jgi:hypothetical protein
MSKFTHAEKETVKSVVARLSVKRIPDKETIQEVYNVTGKTITRMSLYSIRQQIKKESYYWYQRLREGHYEYIHEFKERIREIEDLMKMHHEIIANNKDNPTIQQTSLAELHRLNITLSNYFDVAPSIVANTTPIQIKNDTISIPQKEIIV